MAIRVFMWNQENQTQWMEISMQEYLRRLSALEFENRFFAQVPAGHDANERYLIECSPQRYQRYKKEDRRQEYLSQLERQQSIVSIDALCERGNELQPPQEPIVEEIVLQKIMIETVRCVITKLPPCEQEFVRRMFFLYEGSVVQTARYYNISHQAVSKRKKEILKKLKKLVADFKKIEE